MRVLPAMLLLAALALLTGCTPIVDQDQTTASGHAAVELTAGHSLGQTFKVQHVGLNGVEIWLIPKQPGQGEILLHLRAGPEAQQDQALARLPLSQVTAPGFYRFDFPIQPDSYHLSRYAELELTDGGQVAVGAGQGDNYTRGALYQDGRAQDSQLAFRLVYDQASMWLGQAQMALGLLALMALVGLLFVLPGWAALAWMWRGEGSLAWGSILGAALGLSLAIYPLLFLWTNVAGLHLGAWNAWLPVLIGLVALIWRYARTRPRQWRAQFRAWRTSPALWPDLALLAVVGILGLARLAAMNTLDAPSWGDSVQHSIIAQLFLDHGGLFSSWAPYAPYSTLSVHYGFSVVVALLAWVTQLNSADATVLAGQILSAAGAVTLYPLALRISGGNRWAGTAAVLAAGLLSPLPAYYINWGRYAQLSGQVILPVALWLVCELLARTRIDWRLILLAAVTAAGMALCYYRMPWYYATFVLAWLICYGLSQWQLHFRPWLQRGAWLALTGATAILLIYPWRSHLSSGNLVGYLVFNSVQPVVLSLLQADYQTWQRLPSLLPVLLQVASALALLWSLLLRRWMVVAIALWVALLSLLPAARLLGLPGAGMIDNFSVLIAFYIPAGLLAGWLLGELAERLSHLGGLGKRRVSGLAALAGAAMLVLAGWGYIRQANIVDNQFMLVTQPDLRAMEWIKANTPADARFLVEGFRTYEGRSAVGADAGWWIPLLAGRSNTMPPQYAMLNETPAEQGYTQKVVDLVAALEKASPAAPQNLRLLCAWGITHVYVGQGQGQVGLGATQLFAPAALASSPAFREVYRRDRVHIFALDRSVCSLGASQ